MANTELRAKGVTESHKAWNSIVKRVPAVARLEMRGFAKAIATESRSRLAAREGGFRQKRVPGAIGSDNAGDKFIVYIERERGMVAAEFGARTHHVYGRKMKQTAMRRRTAGGWGRTGKVVGPLMSKPRNTKRNRELADKGLTTISKELSRFGVPR